MHDAPVTRQRSTGLLVALTAAGLLLGSCAPKPAPAPKERHYQMTGDIVSLDPKLDTATIKAGPIAGWMDAMTMEFPVRSKSEFEQLRPGDHITATVNVRGMDYDLTGIHRQPAK